MRFDNYNQYKIVKKEMEKKIAFHYPDITNQSGIYMFYRVVAYIGKSSEKDGILGRVASHCIEHKQHIDNSLHNRKLTCDGGQWAIIPLTYCDKSQVDEMERHYIDKYIKKGYELYNIESGGTNGKQDIAQRKEMGGYRKGKKAGYEQARKEVAKLFEKNLTFAVNGNTNKLKERAYEKFKSFLTDK